MYLLNNQINLIDFVYNIFSLMKCNFFYIAF